jgi:cellulose synthase/poly-beta-1,6-N-acetylglucosamine synthase-like glycosyltransferase
MLKDTMIYISAYIGLFAVIFYALNLFAKKEKHPEFPEKKPPFVSIIIPMWNEAKGIAGTIKSALEIDYPKNKLEIIVIDDGSTDESYKIASKLKSKRVRVFKHLKNKGKGAAMNTGISKAKGEIIVTMDADNTHVKPNALKHMISYFDNPKVHCVSPIIAVYKPKGILQRIQQVEYMLGAFLRKAFSSMNAIHITPGAFSAYRKSFFNKHGGFDEDNLTEDLEIALRIQSNNYIIKNSLKANVFAVAPKKFKALLLQRRRWYTGLLRNLWDYKHLFSRKYGAMGTIVLPVALITVAISVFLTSYLAINTLIKLKKELILWKTINFNILSSFDFNLFLIERYIFLLFSDPLTFFAIAFFLVLILYMVFAKRHVKDHSKIKLSIIWFFFIYGILFAFWWTISFFYAILNKKTSWR